MGNAGATEAATTAEETTVEETTSAAHYVFLTRGKASAKEKTLMKRSAEERVSAYKGTHADQTYRDRSLDECSLDCTRLASSTHKSARARLWTCGKAHLGGVPTQNSRWAEGR